ncbi:MAG: ATP-dependent Clp protease proteolytic subunit [Bacteroidales bacterium]
MAILKLNIDGFIGAWGYSKQWLNQMLQGHENDPIELTISSLGGSVDHGLMIHDRLATHAPGVNVYLMGFVASMATVLAQSGQKRVMSSNGLFLIHKVLSWIDEFGYFNEDDIETLIARLEKEKNENAKMTLLIAKIYSARSGKPVKEILDLMKEETWLTAEEALEWGFIDEIRQISGNSDSLLNDLQKVAMISANGLPMPSVCKPRNSSQNTQPVMNKNFKFINDLLGFEGLESDAEGVYLSLDQLALINTRLEENSGLITGLTAERDNLATERDNLATERDNLATERDNLTTERDNLATERDTLTAECDNLTAERDNLATERDTNNSAIGAIHESVAQAADFSAKVTAIRALIAAKPGVKPIGTVSEDLDTDANDGVDWETIDKLPHNVAIDN